MNRRSFLKFLVSTGGALVAFIVAVPAAITALSPVIRRRQGEIWAPVGRLDEFPVTEVRKAAAGVPWNGSARPLQPKAVFVWRRSDEETVVFSRSCTDLSCPVNYDPGSGWFFCPCHGGIFDEEGTNVAGPPPRPLDRFSVRVREGVLEIDLNSVPPVS